MESIYFFKKYFSVNWTRFRSFDIVDIQVMTQACVLWKNYQNLKNKQTNERYFDVFKLFLLFITSLLFDNFFKWEAADISDHSLWNSSLTKKCKNGGLQRTSPS